jgi:thymidylate kinase
MIVTFSGIDGSGKTTRCRALVNLLQKRGLPATFSKPSYDANDAVKDFCEWAYHDRFAYFDRLSSEFYISCLVADWLAYLARVLSDSQAKILVCDRYIYDVLAQSMHMKAQATTLQTFWERFPRPDISYFLDVSPEIAHARLLARSDPPLHAAESLCELRLLHEAYGEARSLFNGSFVRVKETTLTEELAKEVEMAWQGMQRARQT